MNDRRRNRALRITGTILAFGMLIYLLRRQSWTEILAEIRTIESWRFGVAILLMLVSRAAIIARWHILLRSGGIPIQLRETIRITFAGLFASNFLPTTIGGDVVRLAMILRLEYDRVVSSASLVVDRLIGMAGMASASALVFIPVKTAATGNLTSWVRLTGILAGSPKGMNALRKRIYAAAKHWLRFPRGLLFSFGWTWLHQLCLFGVVWLMLGGLDEPLPFAIVSGLWSLTYFVTLLPVSINGFGLQELSMTAIFSQMGGVAIGTAGIVALMVRSLQMAASLPGVVCISDIFESHRKSIDKVGENAG